MCVCGMGVQEEMEEVSRIEDDLKKLRIDLVWAQYWEQKNSVRAHILLYMMLACHEAMTKRFFRNAVVPILLRSCVVPHTSTRS